LVPSPPLRGGALFLFAFNMTAERSDIYF